MESLQWSPLFALSAGLIFLLKLAQFVPALILFGFVGIRILLALKPKAKPIHIALLRNHAIPGFFQYVRSFRQIDHLYRFFQPGATAGP
jgi:hypothetical protein